MKNLKEHWEALKPEEKQLVGMVAAFTGSLCVRRILKQKTKTIKLVVPKNAEVFIFVNKGGR